MADGSFLKNTKTLYVGASHTTGLGNNATTNIIDTDGYDGVCLLYTVKVTSTVVTLGANGSATTGSFAALSGATAATTVMGRTLIVDLYKPTFRYIQPYINTTGTTNSGGPILAILYGPRSAPTTNASTDVGANTLVARAAT